MNKIMKYILLFTVIISVAACGKKNEKKTADVEKIQRMQNQMPGHQKENN